MGYDRTSALAKHNTRHTGVGKFRIWGSPRGILPHYLHFCKALIDVMLSCNWQEPCNLPFSRYSQSNGQNLGPKFWIWVSLGDTAPKGGENLSGTNMYHCAKFHADQCTIAKISVTGEREKTANLVPYHTNIRRVVGKTEWHRFSYKKRPAPVADPCPSPTTVWRQLTAQLATREIFYELPTLHTSANQCINVETIQTIDYNLSEVLQTVLGSAIMPFADRYAYNVRTVFLKLTF